MASRVNVKFVILLATAVALLFGGVAGAFLMVKWRSGDRFIRMGDAAMARHDYTAADTFYARAVGRDSGNVEWLKKWRSARERKIPETLPIYQQDYSMYVMGLMRTLATAQRTNLEAHQEYLEALYRERALGAGRDAWENLINEAEFCMSFFGETEPPELRRYRGVAIASIIAQDLDVGSERRSQAKADLEAALATNPTDVIAARKLAIWHHDAAQRAERLNEEEQRQEHMAAAARVMSDLVAAAPDDPLALVSKIGIRVAAVERTPAGLRTAAEIARERVEALQAMRPDLLEVHERLATAEAEELTFEVLWRFSAAAARIAPDRGTELTLPLLERARQHAPDAADMMVMHANLLLGTGQVEPAMDVYRALAALPDLPVSLDGVRLWEMRRRARFMMASTAVTLAMQLEPDQRQAALEHAKEKRRDLARHIPERSPEMLFLDGKIDFASRDYSGAQRALAEFIRDPGAVAEQMPEALLMLAESALRRDAPGLARDYLRHLQRLRPDSVDVQLSLARVETALQNPEQAEAIYREILARHPDNEQAVEQLRLLTALREGGDPMDDPVMQRLVETDRLIRGTDARLGDEEAAKALLRQALLVYDYDPRLAIALVRLKLLHGEAPAARAVLEESLARHPDSDELLQIRRQVAATDSLEAMLALIDEASDTELQRWIGRHSAYSAHGQPEKAREAVAEALRLAPEDPTVVELAFVTALRRGELSTAEELADRAARLDIDRADGDTFRARLLLARDDPQQAATTLQRAAERGNATPALLRLLGMTQMQLGRTTDGIATLRRAMELSPTDLDVIKTLMSALVQANQLADALAVAQEAAAHARRDPEFLHAWLNLEARGGRIRFAREWREQILARSPENRDNKVALAELYIAERRFDRARQLIDELGGAESLTVAALNARLHADRGNIQGAQQAFLDHIERLKAEERPTGAAWLTLGQFLLQRGQVDASLEALHEAIAEQDPETRNVEVAIADVLLSLGRLEEAEAKYRTVLDAGVSDPQHAIRKRLVDAQVQQRRFEEARDQIARIDSAHDDVQLMALRSEVARGLGDLRQARELLDRAVARFPDEPLGYMRRARLLMHADAAFAGDAMADLATALRLRPGLWQAHRMRSQIHFANGQIEDGLAELVAAVNANPGLDELRFDTIRRLLDHDREAQAMDVAVAGATRRPTDARLMTTFGDLFAAVGRWDAGVRFYRQAWDISQDERIALRLTQSLINAAPRDRTTAPQLAEAQQILASPALNVNQSMNLLMTRAALRQRLGHEDAARGDALQAFSLVGANPQLLVVWQEQLRQVYGDASRALELFDSVRPRLAEGLRDWHQFARILAIASIEENREEAIGLLTTLAGAAEDAMVRLNALKYLSDLLSREERWAQALDAAKEGLAMAEDDVMLNNNIAHFLVEKLDRPEEALPYAHRALQHAPDNTIVLDTLAAALWATGERAKAIETLNRALRTAQTETDTAEKALKLGRWKLETGDRSGARTVAELARDTIVDMTGVDDELRRALTDLLESIHQAR